VVIIEERFLLRHSRLVMYGYMYGYVWLYYPFHTFQLPLFGKIATMTDTPELAMIRAWS